LIEEVLAKMAEQTKDNNIETVVSDNELFINAIENLSKKTLKKGQKLKGRITHISEDGINLNFEFSKKE